MSDEYEITGIIVKKKESGGGEGCIGCFAVLILLSVIGSYITGKDKNDSVASAPPSSSVSAMPAENSPVSAPSPTYVTAPAPAPAPKRVRCRSCRGGGKVTVTTTCPTCNGRRKVVDQVRTAQNAGRDIARAIHRRQPPRQKTYYMDCPSCNGRGRLRERDNCRQCGGAGTLIRR